MSPEGVPIQANQEEFVAVGHVPTEEGIPTAARLSTGGVWIIPNVGSMNRGGNARHG